MRSVVPTPEQARTVIIGARFALAAGTWLVPRVSGRAIGIAAGANPASPYLGRLYGARAALMAMDLLNADPTDADRAATVTRRHLAVDAADVAASIIAARGGYLSRRSSWLTGATAFALFALGLRASQRWHPPAVEPPR